MSVTETIVSFDEVLRESYRIKDELAKTFDYDMDRLLAYLRDTASQHRDDEPQQGSDQSQTS